MSSEEPSEQSSGVVAALLAAHVGKRGRSRVTTRVHTVPTRSRLKLIVQAASTIHLKQLIARAGNSRVLLTLLGAGRAQRVAYGRVCHERSRAANQAAPKATMPVARIAAAWGRG